MGCYLIAKPLMKNTNHFYRKSVKYMTASVVLMPFTGVFGVSMFYSDGVYFLMYLLLFVLFGTFAWVFFDNAIRLLSKSQKQPKKIVHQLYTTPYEQYKIDMEIEKGSEKEKMMDRFHAKYSPIKGTEL